MRRLRGKVNNINKINRANRVNRADRTNIEKFFQLIYNYQ